MKYRIKKVSDLKPGDRIYPDLTVKKVEWFLGGWRSRPGWHIEIESDQPRMEYYHPHTAECLCAVEE